MRYVTYFRVSTNKQGASGLGIEAQRAAVNQYLSSRPGDVLGEFVEVGSGKKNTRPQLQAALRMCRLTGATLLIAKLDRLSRNRSFLMALDESKLDFVCCDMPEANPLTIGVMACMADYERQLISERTKAALVAAKARGATLGNPRLNECRHVDTKAATAAKQAKTSARNAEIKSVVSEMIQLHGQESTRALAKRLNDAGYRTYTGKEWSATQVWRLIAA